MAQLSLTFLGSFHVAADNQALTAFTTDKARGLLVYLAVEGGRPHTRAALAGLLWPDQPEERARQSLRQTLLYLRQALGPCADRLRADRDGAELVWVPGDRLDVSEFSALSDGCHHHQHRRASRCLPCLRRREAMAELYRGEFLAGFFVDDSDRFEEWAVLRREWFHREAIESLETLVAYRERRGDLQAAREIAHRQVALEPWSEEAHRVLMRLMAHEGRRTSALAQYEACRRALAEELRVEPTAETTALYTQILHETLPPAPAVVAPHPPSPLLGRDAELEELTGLLAGPQTRLITLVGLGGIGKTHLARQIAQDHLGTFRDGIAFASLETLGGSASDAEIGAVIAEALGLAASAVSEPWVAILEHLRRRELLLVLDNLEQLLDCPAPELGGAPCVDRIAKLLHQAPNVVVLATSRERLRLLEEIVYDVDGLAYRTTPADPEPDRYGAVALFTARARQVRRHFVLDASTLPDVIHLCELVQGVPLAIELAAATLTERTLADTIAVLSATLDTLTTPFHDVTPRHRSLRAAFEHSWTLLTDDEQRHLAGLSVFVDSFTPSAASAVLGVSSAAALASLLRKSLLRRGGDDRFSLHGIIAEYAAEKLAADPLQAAAYRARHAAHYAALARRLEPSLRSADAVAATTALQQERAHLRTAWVWAIGQEDCECLESLATAFSLLCCLRGPLPEGVAQVRAVVARLWPVQERHGPSGTLLPRLHLELARLLSTGAHYGEALEAAERGLALAAPSPALEAEAQLLVGQILVQRAAYEPARTRLATALDLAQSTELPLVAADALRELANIANRQRAIEQARALYDQALSIYRSHGDIRGETAVLNNLGALEYDLGNSTVGRALLSEALTLYRKLGDDRGAAKALNNLANFAAGEGDHSDALTHYGEALHLMEAMGNTRGQSVVLNNRGTVLWAVGQYVAADAHYRRALRIYRESGNEQAAAETLANQALLAYSTGDYASAVATAEQAIAISETFGDVDNLANAWSYLAKAQTEIGALDAAEASLQRALGLRGDILHPESATELQAELAYLTLLRGRPHDALAQLGPVLDALAHDLLVRGAEEPLRVHWICHHILSACGDPRADHVLGRARATLLAQAERLADPEMRRSYLEAVAIHRTLLSH